MGQDYSGGCRARESPAQILSDNTAGKFFVFGIVSHHDAQIAWAYQTPVHLDMCSVRVPIYLVFLYVREQLTGSGNAVISVVTALFLTILTKLFS